LKSPLRRVIVLLDIMYGDYLVEVFEKSLKEYVGFVKSFGLKNGELRVRPKPLLVVAIVAIVRQQKKRIQKVVNHEEEGI
jgi:hypothetical protein